MSRKREHEAEKENGERWMLTYLDLITLLMIFFVVLYSMSALDAQKFAAVAESLNNALGGGTPSKIELSTNPTGPSLIQSGVTPSDTNVPSSGTDATNTCLLYTSDAADEEDSVDLGGRRIIKKKKKKNNKKNH